MKIKKGILFIADGSILNPIIYTQGLPLFNQLNKDNYNTIFLTFEEENKNHTVNDYLDKIKSDFPFIRLAQIKRKNLRFLPNWISYFFFSIPELLKILSENNIKIVHARSLFPGILSLILNIFFRIDIIYDNRGAFIEEEILKGHWKRKSLKWIIFTLAEVFLIKKACHNVVVSNRFKSYVQNKYSFERKIITVIPNRTIIQAFDKSGLIKTNKPIKLVYSGSGAAWQDIDELMLVLRDAIKIFGNIEINIISYDIELIKEKFLNELEIFPYINFMKLNKSEVNSRLIKNNFGLLIRENNIINNVASPLKFAEYLSAGLPVLISEGVGDTEEWVEKYKIGIIIRNKNYNLALKEMEEILRDPQVYERCRNIAEKYFDIKDSIDQYKEIYEMICYE
jgi:glycosyltransferase involved in cell wall biosynthesis